MNVQNLGYPLPHKTGAKTTYFRPLRNLGANFPAIIVGSKHKHSIDNRGTSLEITKGPPDRPKTSWTFVDMKLNFRTHIAKNVSKAYQRCNILLRCFTHTSVSLLLKAFLIYVRPILEYASVVWSPSCSSLITELEKAQRRFTKCVSGLSNRSYRDRLKTLALPTLEGKRLTADFVTKSSMV